VLALFASLVAPAATITWNNTSGGNWSLAGNWTPNQVPGSGDIALITNTAASYTVTLDVPATVGGLVVGGSSGAKTVTLNQSSQELVLQGAATIAPSGVLDIGVGGVSLSAPLTNNGTVNWQAGAILMYNDGTANNTGLIWNAGKWNISTSQTLYGDGVAADDFFYNRGTITMNETGGGNYIEPYLDNTGGSVVATAGTIDFTGGSNLGGSFQANTGAEVQFSAGTYNWNGTANFSGNVQITGGTVNVTASVTSLAASYVTITGLSNIVSGAYLTNCTIADAERITGTVYWTDGTINNGASLTVAGTGVLNLIYGNGNYFGISGPLTNNGTVNWSGGGLVINNDNGVSQSGGIWNLGTWNIQGNLNLSSSGGGGYQVFYNAGHLMANATADMVSFAPFLNNTGGSVVAQGGSFGFSGGSDLGGSFQASSGGVIDFTGGILNWNGTANFSGNVQITGGTVNVTASVTSLAATGVTITGMSNIVSGAYLTNCIIADAEQIVGTVHWAGDVINNSGSLTVAPTGTLNLVGGGNGFGLNGPLTNNGTVNWSGGSLSINNNGTSYTGVIWNAGMWNIQAGLELGAENGDGFTGHEFFQNTGSLVINIMVGQVASFQSGLVNGGTVDVESGTLSLSSGSTLEASGTAKFGLNSLTSYGSISQAGSATLAGKLTARLNNGYVPIAVGTSFPVVTYGSAAGTFTITNLPGVAVWQPTYGATALSLEVVKLVPQMSWAKPANIVYGTALSGTQLDPTFASPVSGGTNITGTFTYTPASGTILDWGSNQTLTVKFTPKDLTDFTNVTGTQTITVTKAPLTVTANSNSKTYGQTFTPADTAYTTSGLVNGDTVTSATLASTGSDPASPVSGSPYPITITNAVGDGGLTNYTITYMNGTLTVNKAPLTVTANAESKTYGQTVTFGGGSTLFTPTGLQNSETIGSVTLAVSGSGGAPTASVAGSPYTIMPSAATGGTFSAGNYTITYATGHLTVNPAALTVTANAQSKTYGQTVTFGSGSTLFTPTGLQNSETIGSVTLAVSGSGGAATASVAGSPYTITPSAATGGTFTAGNYTITYATGHLTVSPAALTVTANAQSKTYGQTVTFGSGSTLFTHSALQNSETIGTVTLAVNGSGGSATASVAGSPYSITPSAATGGTFTAGNYDITYITGNLIVNPAALTVTASPQSKSYGQTIAFGNGSTLFTSSALQNGETIGSVTLAVSGNGGTGTAPVAGSPYTITPSAATGGTFTPGNYTITYAPGSLTVSRAALTVAASAESKIYGQIVIFGSGSPLFAPTGLQNSETIGSVTLAVSGSGGAATASVAGSPYTITPSAATGGTFTAANYTITYVIGQLTVSPAALTITANPQGKTYGQTVTFGAGSTLFTPAGLQNGETIGSVTLAVNGNGGAATAPLAGSPYTITPSAATGGTFAAGNYTVTYAPGSLTVTPATLTVTAGAQSKTYGQTVTFGSGSTLFTHSALQNGETIGSVTLAVSGNGGAGTAAVANSPYIITPSAATGGTFAPGNYSITYNPGSLTVNPAALTVAASAESKTYGQTVAFGVGSTLFKSSALQNGETIGSVTLAVSGNGGAGTATVASSPYTITPSAATGGTFTPGNYSITYDTAQLSVSPAALAITATGPTKTYGTALTAGISSINFTAAGLQNSETVTSVTLTPGANGLSATVGAGTTYTVTPSAATGAGGFATANYTITYQNYNGVVGPAPLTITANGQSKTYGQTETFGSGSTLFTASGLKNSDAISSVTITDTDNGGAAGAVVGGTYDLTPGAAVFTTGTAANYAITYDPGLLTINPATPAVAVTVGTYTYTGLPQGPNSVKTSTTDTGAVTWSYAGSGATVYAASANPPAAAGTYTATATVAADANNNQASSGATPFAIGKASLTVAASPQNKTYGQTVAFGSGNTNFLSTGLQNGETIGTVTLAVTGNGGAGTASVAGSPYTITPSSATGGTFTTANYAIAYAPGSLTVSPAALSITADNTNKYAGEILVFAGTEFTASGLQNGETIGTVTLTSPGTPIAAAVGVYAITPSTPAGGTFSLGNYSPAFVNGALTVSTTPVLTIAQVGNQYVLTFPTLLGQNYQVQSTTNLAASNWTALGSALAGTGGTLSLTNLINSPQAFFQVLIAP